MTRTTWRRRHPDHTVTQNDNGVFLEDILRDNRGELVDLTGITEVRYQAKRPGQATLDIDKAGSVVGTATDGHVRVTLLAADTDLIGAYLEQWRVTFGGGEIQRYPAGKHKLLIEGDVA